MILAVYVDDLVIASNDKEAVQNLKQALQRPFSTTHY
jgi:hypothetical protein